MKSLTHQLTRIPHSTNEYLKTKPAPRAFPYLKAHSGNDQRKYMDDIDNNKVEDNSVNLAFSLMQKELDAEELRNKNFETKAQILIASCGIILSAYTMLFKIMQESICCKLITYTLYSIGVFLLISAMYELFCVLKIRKFDKPSHNLLSEESVYNKPELELKKSLIADYYNCIEKSYKILGSKSDSIKAGMDFIIKSIFIFFIIVLLAIYIPYIRGVTIMSKNQTGSDNKTNQKNNSKNETNDIKSIITENAKNIEKKGGLGTVEVERGQQK